MYQHTIDHTPITGASAVIYAEAARIIDDVLHAIELKPERARVAALRLVALLTPPAETEHVIVYGGLAPWQKRKLKQYLSEHLEDQLCVDDLAKQVSLSSGHFSRAFKESFGTTPHRYLIRLRLALAQRLMLTTEDSLNHIALSCGFADQAHFSRWFRREVDTTPGVWRRQNLTYTPIETKATTATVYKAA